MKSQDAGLNLTYTSEKFQLKFAKIFSLSRAFIIALAAYDIFDS